jgi:hypothetical protein
MFPTYGVCTVLVQLSMLTCLEFNTSEDALCGVVAQLPCLRSLGMRCRPTVTLPGLRQLTALSQLTVLQLGWYASVHGSFCWQRMFRDQPQKIPPWFGDDLVFEPDWGAFNKVRWQLWISRRPRPERDRIAMLHCREHSAVRLCVRVSCLVSSADTQQ